MEIWKNIPDYEGLYQVSNLGNVKRIYKTSNEKILKPTLHSNGYYVVTLKDKERQKVITIHKLVAICFLNHIPSGMNLVVDHINNNKLDNNVNNLRIVTQQENTHKVKFKTCTSKYNGVCFVKRANKWVCYKKINGKRKHLGYYNTETEAYNKLLSVQ